MEGRKWEIFKSSVDLFSKNGYDNTSMRDIADANGIKAASLYNHFPSKETILRTMYDFYYANMKNSENDLSEIFALIPTKTAKEVLFATMMYYEEELQPFMDKIYLISLLRSMFDTEASELVWKYNFNHTKLHLGAVLQRMIDVGKIEPLDIEGFINIFTSFSFTAIFKQNTNEPIGMENWLKGLDLIFSLVKEKTDAK